MESWVLPSSTDSGADFSVQKEMAEGGGRSSVHSRVPLVLLVWDFPLWLPWSRSVPLCVFFRSSVRLMSWFLTIQKGLLLRSFFVYIEILSKASGSQKAFDTWWSLSSCFFLWRYAAKNVWRPSQRDPLTCCTHQTKKISLAQKPTNPLSGLLRLYHIQNNTREKVEMFFASGSQFWKTFVIFPLGLVYPVFGCILHKRLPITHVLVLCFFTYGGQSSFSWGGCVL